MRNSAWLRTHAPQPTSTLAGCIVLMLIALADVAIVVSNAKASAKWWKEKVGFAVHTIGESGHAVLIAPPGERFVLHLCEGIAPLEPGDTGIAFVTDDIAGLAKRMLAKGVHFPEPVATEEWGGRAKFADPDGNVFWLLGAPAPFVRATTRLRAPSPVTKKRATKSPRKRSSDRRAK